MACRSTWREISAGTAEDLNAVTPTWCWSPPLRRATGTTALCSSTQPGLTTWIEWRLHESRSFWQA